MTRRASILTLGCIYIGTVIGAGFASGQEILQFFGKHGKIGIIGVVLSTVMFCALGSKLLQMVYERRLNNFDDFLSIYFDPRSRRATNTMMTFILLIGYFVMLAGGGAILKAMLGLDSIYGILIMSGLCFGTFMFGVDGIAKANNIIVPVLMLIVVIFTSLIIYYNAFMLDYFMENPLGEIKIFYDNVIRGFGSGEWKVSLYMGFGWLWSAILYCAFNSLVAVVVLSSLRPFIRDRKSAKYGGIIGGVGLGGMALLILISLLFYYSTVYRLEVPMIAVANNLGAVPKQIYSLLLWFAMFTTAIANGYGCITNVVELGKIPEGWSRLLVCVVSIPLAMVGFKQLISFFYPILGYMGLLFILLILMGRKK
ncbi:YkvI family membrane protein [Alkaliphilus hydrothermalis]|uniref:Membrane protein YkvI n=1 Tax=Alkaliphilus hydrothermalis TaxID=1482730 RepID=A0ABS2NRH9_9FIRM|nr:hypothetical protein [Alkaliphilus hydrothermalis]MBM7615574.1 putative membrane protein YkvI [Alkaliphilus hydrothermalis]